MSHKEISRADLKFKLREYEGKLQEVQAKIDHIKFVLSEFGDDELEPSGGISQRVTLKQAMLEAMRGYSSGISRKAIMQSLMTSKFPFSDGNFDARLSKLIKSGQVEKVDYGVYRLKA